MMIIKIKILIIKNKYKNKIITMIENNSNNIKIKIINKINKIKNNKILFMI